jgi:hypothetical protein
MNAFNCYIDDSNGSPFDRGCADKVYGRERLPHKYPEGTYKGERVTSLNNREIAEYNFGYDLCFVDTSKV